jgi:hypothetical protein
MPATSIAQQRLMGQAYALKTGELKPEDLNPKYRKQIEDLADSMSEKDLKDYAETSHEDLPQTVKENNMKFIPTFESFVNESSGSMTFDDLKSFIDNPYGIGAQLVTFTDGNGGNSGYLIFKHDDKYRRDQIESKLKTMGVPAKKMSKSMADKAYKYRFELIVHQY